MNYLQKNFIFLSQIIGVPVINLATGGRIGRVSDITAGLREMYPKVSGLMIVSRLYRKGAYIAWDKVKKIIEEKAIYVDIAPDASLPSTCPENEILLKDTFWDKQIVDISGSKVVRVNDLHLLKEDLGMWVVHMDVGITGLVRRLGWIHAVTALVRLLFSYDLKDRLISWKFVQPIGSAIGAEALALKVHHSKLSELHPADLADILLDLGNDERIPILRSLDPATAAQTFQELPLKVRVQVAGSVDLEQIVSLVNDMAMDEAVDLLSELPKKRVNTILGRLPSDKSTQIYTLLGHSERVAGSIMNTEFVSARQTAAAGAVLEKIRTESRKKETIYYVYVTDENDNLVGVVTLRQLLTVPPERITAEFMRKRIAKVRVDTDIKDVAEIFYKYDFTVVPVIDKQNKMQGIITMKDAFESVFREIREETEETT